MSLTGLTSLTPPFFYICIFSKKELCDVLSCYITYYVLIFLFMFSFYPLFHANFGRTYSVQIKWLIVKITKDKIVLMNLFVHSKGIGQQMDRHRIENG